MKKALDWICGLSVAAVFGLLLYLTIRAQVLGLGWYGLADNLP